jgi:NADH:ubiquinone oxidoreductase subunit F (NADH-binding)/ferredoxin/(2Fe-2S) ferredoxin
MKNNRTTGNLTQRLLEPDAGGKAFTKNEMAQLATLQRRQAIRPTVYVGAGTCGLGAGAAQTIEAVRAWFERRQIDGEVVRVGCIGLCSAEPILDVQLPGYRRISFQNVRKADVDELLDRVFQLDVDASRVLGQFETTEGKDWEGVPALSSIPFFRPQQRLVLRNCGLLDPTSIDEYIATGGYAPLRNTLTALTPAEVCGIIEKSGLRGRGGGGFLTGAKWKMALETPSEEKYLICNADEGDPGAFMDRAVVEGDPHRLIEGMAIAAYAIGARKAYVYIRAEYPLAIERLQIALHQAEERGFIGQNIFGSGFDLQIRVKKGAGAFVCGEETALIHSIEGKRGMPRPRPPYPSISGLHNSPTCINNVETLANVSGILERGWEWFSSIGTEHSKGTKVFALSGKVNLTGLVEIPMGTPLREIIFDIAGGIRDGKKFKAVQIGGPSGGCITEENLDIRIDYRSLLEVGAMMGSGGLVVMDEETCMVDVAKFFMEFIQRESCGKCIPCREGTRRMLEILHSITSKPADLNGINALERFKGVTQLERLARVIKETSLCGLGQSAPNPVLSTLRWFREEYEEHIFERKCSCNVCTELRTFVIDADKCTGCAACVKKCPTGAIIGARKSPHFIQADKCIGCGACEESCRYDSIYVK